MKNIPNFIIKRIILAGIVLMAMIFFVWLFLQRPSHDRDWEVGQEALPKITIDDEMVTIENYRNFIWYKDGSVDKNYETREFNLDELQSVDVFISHFDDFEGLAHIFLSFRFTDGKNIVVSLETRRETGEEFSPVLGVLRQFEIIYVVGSEEDIVGLRTNIRGERVYVYPTIATPEKSRELFLNLAEEINNIYQKPKIYNTLLRNCTNEITRQVEKMSELNFPITWKSILPGYFDEILYEMKIIPNARSFKETKKQHEIDNAKVDNYSDNYTKQIRDIIK